MLRKQLLRQSRAICESFTSTSTSTSLPQVLVRRSAPFSTTSFASNTRAALPAYQSSRILGRRWQSTESATQTPDAASSEAKSDGTATEAAKEDPIKAELEKKNKEVIDLKDKYLRSVADYRNLQERTKRDMDSAKQFAIQRFAADLLDSIDNLDRALISVPKESVTETPSSSSSTPDHKKDLLSLYSGLKMSEEILLSTLKKHGLERFDPTEGEGRKFDPNTDEATFFTKVEGKQDGEVFFVQSKGFKLNGRVIRAAKVGVVKNS